MTYEQKLYALLNRAKTEIDFYKERTDSYNTKKELEDLSDDLLTVMLDIKIDAITVTKP